jgi:gamma-glutamylcyclotransferase (GGCT)/AIG2-like uncharacterized protein YtfP
MTANVFTYGSLMFDPVWSEVVSGSYDRFEAILQGYERKSVRDEDYPVIVSSTSDSQVPGIVYRDVSTADLTRLNQFEGEYYFRKTVEVTTLEMIKLPAEVYVLKEEYYSIISFQEWDPVHFSSTGIHSFLLDYVEKYKKQRRSNV